MIKAMSQYFRDEAWPRFREIISGSELWIALTVGVVCGLWGNRILPGDIKIGDIVSGLLTYASIAFGFCLAGLTIALTLPDQKFTKKLATSKTSQMKFDAYSDLFFVFSWTALSHWVAIVYFICALVLVGPQQEIFPITSSILRRVFVGITFFISSYAVFQFLITLITLSQVGRLYIKSLHED